MSPSLRDRARRGARAAVRRALDAYLSPDLTVVIDARGREADVRASIDSARDQPDRSLEILVVLVDERLRALAQGADAGDRRVRIVPAIGADPATGRRLGAEAARGSSLVFLPPRQELLPGGLSLLRGQDGLLVGEAETDGRGPSTALGRLRIPRAAWLVTEDDAEPAGQTAALRLQRDQPALPVRTKVLRDRGPLRPRPFEPQVNPLPQLEGRIAFDVTMLELANDPSTVAAGLLARDLPPFLEAAERCDDQQWVRLQRTPPSSSGRLVPPSPTYPSRTGCSPGSRVRTGVTTWSTMSPPVASSGGNSRPRSATG